MSVQRQHRILVVDDDPQVLTLFAQILTEGGYAVTATNQSSEVAQVLRDQFVDLLILDLDMPRPDGFEVLRSLRARRSTLRILIVSGYLQGSLLEASELLGATASLSKADAPRMLLETVNGILR